MAPHNNNSGSVQRACSDEDPTTLSDLKKLMEKQGGDMSAIQESIKGVMREILEVKYRLMQVETAVKRDMIETKAHSSGPRWLKLVFNNKISLPVLSGEEIKGGGGKYLEIALVDDVTGNVVDFGREASAQVEIVALEGDFDECERDSWVIGKYKNKIASVGEEQTSVLLGNVKLKLNKGIGSLVNIKFKNSSNHNSGVFKLGAKVIDTLDGTLVKEATTESFVVNDFRRKYTEKRHPPSPSDEVYRLENIQKNGPIHKRLMEKKVNSVEDFLIELLKDSEGLKTLVRMGKTKWEATVAHAQTCRVNQKVYCRINSQEKKGVAFCQDVLQSKNPSTSGGIVFQEVEASLDDTYNCLPDIGPTFSTPGCTGLQASLCGPIGLHQYNVDEMHLNSSPQDVLQSKNPSTSGVTVFQEVEASLDDTYNCWPDMDLPFSTPGGIGLEARLSDSISTDQFNVDEMHLNSSSQDVLQFKNPSTSGGTEFQEVEASLDDTYNCLRDMAPSFSPRGGTGLEARLSGPIGIDQVNVDEMNSLSEDILQSKNPGGSSGLDSQDFFPSNHLTESTRLENFGSDGAVDTETGTNILLSSRDQRMMGTRLYNLQLSGSLIDSEPSSSLVDNDNWLTHCIATQLLAGEVPGNDLSRLKRQRTS